MYNMYTRKLSKNILNENVGGYIGFEGNCGVESKGEKKDLTIRENVIVLYCRCLCAKHRTITFSLY